MCPFVNLPLENPRSMGTGYYPCSDEDLHLGRAGVGRSNQIYRMDQRQSAAPARLLGLRTDKAPNEVVRE
jgi:hypothetical protein